MVLESLNSGGDIGTRETGKLYAGALEGMVMGRVFCGVAYWPECREYVVAIVIVLGEVVDAIVRDQ